MTSNFLFNLPVAAGLCVMLAALLYLTYRLFDRYDIGNCLLWLPFVLGVLVDLALFYLVLILSIDELQKLPAPWPTIEVLLVVLGLIVLWVIHNRKHLFFSLTLILILVIPIWIISLFSQFIQTEIEKYQPLPLIVIILLFLFAIWVQSNSPLAKGILNAAAGVLLFIPMSLLVLYQRAVDWWKSHQRTKPKT